jgi:flagellar biosynthesis protein FliR
MASEVGLIAAPGFDTPTPAQEPLPTFIGIFAGVLFFAFGAHESVLIAYARSFSIAPVGLAGFSPQAAAILTRSVAELIELALRMAAPFIALNFVITLSFAILGRAVPKMNVFVISFSFKSLLGLTLLTSAGALFASYLYEAFDGLPWRMLELVGRR